MDAGYFIQYFIQVQGILVVKRYTTASHSAVIQFCLCCFVVERLMNV